MTKDDVLQRLRRELNRSGGTQTGLAARLGVSIPYINDVLHGRREPGKAILDALNLERVISYREKKK